MNPIQQYQGNSRHPDSGCSGGPVTLPMSPSHMSPKPPQPTMPHLVVLANDFDKLATSLHSQVSTLESAIERIGGGFTEIMSCKQVGANNQEVETPTYITLKLGRVLDDLFLLRGRLENAINRLHTLA